MPDDDMAFDFTEAELYSAFRLALADEEARAHARDVAEALRSGSDWGASAETLMLLGIGSHTASEKVERIRRVEQEARFSTWIKTQLQTPGQPAAPEELRSRWLAIAAAEDRDWQQRREALRRSLQEQGKLPPDG